MKAILRALKRKSTWAGLSGIAGGIALIVSGDAVTGAQAIITGASVIFLRQAIAKNGTDK